MILLVLAAFAIIALLDYPVLIKQKKWYELSVLSAFYLSAFVLAMLQYFNVKIPSPIKGAQFIIHDVLHLTHK